MPHLCRKRCFHKTRGREQNITPKVVRAQEVKEPSVPCGVSLVTFPLCPKNASACAMGFWLTERIQRAQRVGHSLVKESYPSETGQAINMAGSL